MQPHRSQDGFTLIELLVAASLAGIGFVGLAALHANAIRTTSVGRNANLASTLAAEQIESMRRTPVGALASVPSQSVLVGNRSFQRQVTVTAAPTGSARQVTVDVDWTDQLGGHRVELVTVIGQ